MASEERTLRILQMKYVLGVGGRNSTFPETATGRVWVFQDTLNFNNPNPEAKAHPSTLPIGHHP